MSVQHLLGRLRQLDVRLWLDGERLRFSAPAGVMTDALKAEVSTRRDEIREWLGRASQAEPATALVKAPADIPPVLSFAQERLWFINQLEPGNVGYNIPLALRLEGDLDEVALEQALCEVVSRHDVLRSRFGNRDGVPAVSVMPPAPVPFAVEDLSHLDAGERVAEASNAVDREMWRTFDLESDAPIRADLIRLDAHTRILVLVLHHVVADAWSLGVLLKELSALYRAHKEGVPTELEPLAFQYADYAYSQRRWLAKGALAGQLSYWRNQLRGAMPGELPADRPRPLRVGSRGGREVLAIDHDTRERLRAFSRDESLTPFVVLLAVFKVLLARHTGEHDVVIGSPVAGRSRAETESMIGCFLNTLVLRTSLAGDPSFRELAARVQKVVADAHENQDVPFETIVQSLGTERDLSRTALFQILFNYIEGGEMSLSLPGIKASLMASDAHTSKFDLTVYAYNTPDGLSIAFNYATDLFESSSIAALLERYRTLLRAALAHPAERIGDLEMLPAEQRRQLLSAEADGAVLATGEPLWVRFQRAVSGDPAREAIVTPEGALDYAGLDVAARGVVSALLGEDMPRQGRVVVMTGHGIHAAAATLGVLGAGLTFVPVDPEIPPGRLATILDDIEPAAIVVDSTTAKMLHGCGAVRARILEMETLPAQSPGRALPGDTVSLDEMAYVLYTSGSSGEPKGVVQSHHGLLAHVDGYVNSLGIEPDDRLSLLSSFAFDSAIQDLFAAMSHGATLCAVDLRRHDGRDAWDWLQSVAVSIVHATPTVYRHLVSDLPGDARMPSARIVILGGEEAHAGDVHAFVGCFPEHCKFINGYGASESTTALAQHIDPDRVADTGPLPVGHPVGGMRVTLLDEAGRNNEIFGEIALIGDHVAREYWRRPALSEERFREHDGTRMFLTGDIARRRADGSIVCLGRKDHQVKIRGMRVELAEVEGAIGLHSDIADACVVQAAQAGDQLAAYFVASGPVPSSDDLRAHLRELLPQYMIPSHFVGAASLPRTVSGKVDRRSLAARPLTESAVRGSDEDAIMPRTDTEQAVAAVWRELLKVERVGVHDSFLDLGGHSLLTTRMVARLRQELGVDLSLDTVFKSPTIAGIADHVEREKSTRARQQRELADRVRQLDTDEREALLAQARRAKEMGA